MVHDSGWTDDDEADPKVPASPPPDAATVHPRRQLSRRLRKRLLRATAREILGSCSA